jgi:hypothetical protein
MEKQNAEARRAQSPQRKGKSAEKGGKGSTQHVLNAKGGMGNIEHRTSNTERRRAKGHLAGAPRKLAGFTSVAVMGNDLDIIS